MQLSVNHAGIPVVAVQGSGRTGSARVRLFKKLLTPDLDHVYEPLARVKEVRVTGRPGVNAVSNLNRGNINGRC